MSRKCLGNINRISSGHYFKLRHPAPELVNLQIKKNRKNTNLRGRQEIEHDEKIHKESTQLIKIKVRKDSL